MELITQHLILLFQNKKLHPHEFDNHLILIFYISLFNKFLIRKLCQ